MQKHAGLRLNMALKEAGVDFELAVSERARHTIELAEKAAREGFSPIIAAGGDGTIGEVVNGLARARNGSRTCWDHSEYCRWDRPTTWWTTWGFRDLEQAAHVIAMGKTRADGHWLRQWLLFCQ